MESTTPIQFSTDQCTLETYPALVIVKDTPVPHQRSMGRGGDQFIEWGDVIVVGDDVRKRWPDGNPWLLGIIDYEQLGFQSLLWIENAG